MTHPVPRGSLRPRNIIVADESPSVAAFLVNTLRNDGHVVFPAYDVLSATQLAVAVTVCDLVISDGRVSGVDGGNLICELRRQKPGIPILYLANTGRSTPEQEARLPSGVAILREPYTPETLRSAVAAILDEKH